MATYKTPGVYVEEISTLPPSVAEVATAIPAFMGYTEITGTDDETLVRRISSMLEYRQHFGGAPPIAYKATVTTKGEGEESTEQITLAEEGTKSQFILYYSLKLFFENGGGPCYVVSIGDYTTDSILATDFTTKGLAAIRLLDEPTLLVFPDATGLKDSTTPPTVTGAAYGQVCNQALAQCQELKDRFTIMDFDSESLTATQFRGAIRSETEFLKYGAAYTPFLNTLMNYELQDEKIQVDDQRKQNQLVEFRVELPTSNINNFLEVKYLGLSNETVSVAVSSAVGQTDRVLFKPTIVEGTEAKLDILIAENQTSITVDDAFIAEWLKLETPGSGFQLRTIRNDTPIKVNRAGTPPPVPVPAAVSARIPTAGGAFLNFQSTIPNARVEITKTTGIAVPLITVDQNNANQLNITIDPANAHTIAQYRTALTTGNVTTFTLAPADDETVVISPEEVAAGTTLLIDDAAQISLPGGDNLNFVRVRNIGSAAGTVVFGTGEVAINETGSTLTITLPEEDFTVNETFRQAIEDAALTAFAIEIVSLDQQIVLSTADSTAALLPNTAATDGSSSLPSLNTFNSAVGDTALYNKIKQELRGIRIKLPASPAIAGVYARVDRISGVWKAPANVSVVGVIGPSQTITHAQQENLNVDAVSGKSINAIRSFTGKGTLVWGGRTLAGNDNEWRYVSVRRLFNLIEESIQKSTSFAVFEPNDTSTWLKVKAMIDSYLYGLWQQGALAGSTPEQAFFVQVGLGKTMTTQDILEGRMIVEIGVAAVRPAEFIILRFSHKLQEA